MKASKKKICFSPLLLKIGFFSLFNFVSQLNTLGDLEVFLMQCGSEQSYQQMAFCFSINIIPAAAPASAGGEQLLGLGAQMRP